MPNYISLFSGGMGLDLGFEQAGFDGLFHQDFDKNCQATALLNNKVMLGGSIEDLINQDPDCTFLPNQEIDVLIGGPPCQPFSNAGKRQSLNDPRGSLFKQYLHVVKQKTPRYFVMENVAPLLNINDGKVFQIIEECFLALNYKILYWILEAQDYGAPQFRERLIVVGSRDHENIFRPEPTHFKRHQNPEYRWRTLGDVIAETKNLQHHWLMPSPERADVMKLVPEGKNWKSLPPDVAQKIMKKAYQSEGGKTGFYRRLSRLEPCPTLLTNPIQQSTFLYHPTEERPLSIEEYRKIQCFPDNWQLAGSLSAQYKQVGNAVPVVLGKAVAQMIKSVMEDNYEIRTKRK